MMGYVITEKGKKIEIPPFVEVIDSNTLRVHTSDWEGSHITTIKRDDVVKHTEGSGLMEIGDIKGDWRQMRELGEILGDIFRQLKNEKIMVNKTKLDEVL